MYNFLENIYKNIPGITVIDSGKPGKNIGLIAITHGNEPVGLKIFEYLIHDFKIQEKLKSGNIYFIANNIDAYKKYSKSGNIDSFRFIHHNMNRISNKEYEIGSVEFRRYEEIKGVFDEIDIAIDIHSVSKGRDIIGITDKEYFFDAKSIFDVETILVDTMGNTGALIGEFIRRGKEAYGIECGNHIDTSGFENGLRNILNLLIFHEVIEGKIEKKYSDPAIFEFIQEIQVQSDTFKFKQDYNGFTKLEKDEIYALDNTRELINKLGDNIYIGIVAKKPQKGDGAGFIFKKINADL